MAVAEAEEGFLYDIAPIKMTEQSGNSDTSTVNNSIPTSSESVNTKKNRMLQARASRKTRRHRPHPILV